MNSSPWLLAIAVALQLAPATASAATLEPGRPDEAQAFDTLPVGDDVLATAVGAQRVPFARNLRGMADAETLVLLQRLGQTSRVALDTWWAGTGAALIARNVIADPTR